MSKKFICKGCSETFDIKMQSSTPNYCYICNDFYKSIQIKKYEAKKEEKLKRNILNNNLQDN